jgi:eukaryotic-like serine/threonine-protein kinase
MYGLLSITSQMLEDRPARRVGEGLEDIFRGSLHLRTITKRLLIVKPKIPANPGGAGQSFVKFLFQTEYHSAAPMMNPNDPQHPADPDTPDRTLSVGASGTMAASQIGPYRLLQVLGEGGMGEVWLAEQTKPIHRTVALKLIKAGMDTKAVVARFESERQALALMDHPNIARVFEAGATPEGRPYFVMEYVPGLPITEYCDKHRLTIAERLELFIQVCEGVQHAHQKAIIHRDLKPSNVLVLEQDNRPVPKIIDFGLAKATAQRLTDKTMFTELGMMLGTPEYMSPEQADQTEQNIDTRTDVYSLGIILYQLLVGMLPFEGQAPRAGTLEAILRMIREQEPPKPSTKIRSLGDTSNALAEKRQEEPRLFARHLQGELDWITMKALEKDRARRYSSPAELGADIRRHLSDEPVLAGPPSTMYRAGKFVRRHRFGVLSAATVLSLLIVFAAAMAVQARRIAKERDRANRQAQVAQRVTNFMTNMFKVSDPSAARGNTITAREILDKGSAQIEAGLSKDPEVQAQMMYVMGDVYENLGLYPHSQALLQQSLEIRQRLLGPENPDTLRSMHSLAWVLERQGRYQEAEKLDRQAIAAEQRVLGPEHPNTLAATNALAVVLRSEGHYADAEKLNRQTLEAEKRVLGPEHLNTLGTMQNLAADLDDQGKYSEAENLYRETLVVRRRVLGPEDPKTLDTMNDLGAVLNAEGRYAEAEKLDRETLDIRRRILGPEHPSTLTVMINLAVVLQSEGHYAEAEKLNRETIEIQRRVLGPEHPDTLSTTTNLSAILTSEGRDAEAEKLDRETFAIQKRVLGPEHPSTLLTMNNLAGDLAKTHQYAEAEKLLKETLEIQRRVIGPDSPDAAISTYNLGMVAAQRGQRDKAFSLFQESVDHGLPPTVAQGIAADPDLKPLHGDPRFDALVTHANERAAAAQKPK